MPMNSSHVKRSEVTEDHVYIERWPHVIGDHAIVKNDITSQKD